MFETLQNAWLPILLVTLIVALVIFLVVLVVRSRRRPDEMMEEAEVAEEDEELLLQEEAATAAAAPVVSDSADDLRRSFTTAIRRLRKHAGRRARYEIPWFLLLGAAGSRPRGLLADLGMGLPFGPPAEMLPPSGAGCNWWFFDGAIVLETGEAYLLREDGGGTDDAGWRTLLNLLEKHRPRRPLDGAVLTVSCQELLEARRQGSEGMADLERRAAEIYRKLVQARRRLGIHFPLYVLITGCEVLPGFPGFCASLPQRLRGDAFGWSSPYSIDTTFQDGWVDEAFSSIRHRLQEVQLETFAEAAETDADELYLFPGSVQALKEPLRTFLAQVVGSNAYLGSMLLRGFYFCGSAQAPAQVPATWDASPAGVGGWDEPYASGASEVFHADESPGPATLRENGWTAQGTRFLRGLLEDKVFPEAVLGRPTADTVVARNRVVRVVQAALLLTAVILAVGVWRAQTRLQLHQSSLEPFLKETARTLREERRQAGSAPTDQAVAQARASRLVNGMARIDAERFGSVFIPSSWLSPFNENLEQAFVQAFERIIFQSLHEVLDQRARSLTGDVGGSRSLGGLGSDRFVARTEGAAMPEAVAVEQLPEFQALDEHVRDLAQLEEIGRVYNGLRDSGDPEELARVIDYLFQTTLPEGFYRRAALYRNALSHVDYRLFDPAAYQSRAPLRVRSLAEDFFVRLYSTFIEDLTRVALELQHLGQPVQGRNFTIKAEAIGDLVDSITRLERALARPETDWAFRETFNLGIEFEDLMTLVNRSSMLGTKLEEDLRREAEAGWNIYRRALGDFRSDLTGPLLIRNRGRVELSLEVLQLQAALRALLSFARINNPDEFEDRIEPGFQLEWESHFLDQAVALEPPYQRFRERQVVVFDPAARPILESVARITVTAKILDLLARAQRFEPLPTVATSRLREDEISAEIERFKAASEPLDQILLQLDRLQAREVRAQLSSLVAEQCFDLLQDVDEILQEEGLYEPRQGRFDWWDGRRPVSYGAFGVSDEEELVLYLDLQRQRLEHLALYYAEPLIKWMQRAILPPNQRPLYRKWSGIVTELKDYQAQKPGNSLATLEAVIQTDLPKLTLETCARMDRSVRQVGESGDFFLEQRSELHRQLFRRCRLLAGQRALAGYGEIEEYFNLRLAGKFPFAPVASGIFAVEAEADDLRGFFRVWDSHAAFLDMMPEGTPRRPEILQFLDAVGEVRAFFAHFLDNADVAALPVYDVDAEFRVNQENETSGHLIIGWMLDIAGRRIDFRDAERRARWTLGRPVRLSLRWARDAPWEPVLDNGSEPVLAGDGQTLVYEYLNRWSLISLLARHGSSAQHLEKLSDTRPHTLVFEIETRPRQAAPAGGVAGGARRAAAEPTRVFVRVTLLEPDSKEPMVLPRFPLRAPELESEGSG